MEASAPPQSAWARGLKSVERMRGGATLYNVVFGPRRPRGGRPVSFADLEAQHQSPLRAWLLAGAAHLLLILLPVAALLPSQTPSPPPEKGMLVDIVMEPGAKAGKGRELLAEAGGSPEPVDSVGVGPGADVLAAAKAEDAVPLGAQQAVEPAAPVVQMSVPVALSREAPAPPGSVAGGLGVLTPEEARWEGQIVARIEKRRRYPKSALAAGIEDNVLLRLVLDREGKLVRAEVVRSAGYSALNAEVLALAKRAQPYPRPPSTVRGLSVTLLVPVEFVIKKAQ